MQRRLWILRHGLRIDFADPGWILTAEHPFDPPLHPGGIRQAAQTAERLQSESIDQIFTSPFRRTVQTGSLIAEKLGKRMNVEAGFSEWLREREFTRMPLVGSSVALHEEFPAVDVHYTSTVEPGYPEDRNELETRIELALKRILANHDGNLLIVSHGSPIEAMHRTLTGTYPNTMPSMASITRFDMVEGAWVLVTDADTSHLTDPDTTNRVFANDQVARE